MPSTRCWLLATVVVQTVVFICGASVRGNDHATLVSAAARHCDQIMAQSLSAKQARALLWRHQNRKRAIDFVGLTTLENGVARTLAQFKGPTILFSGLTRLDAISAQELAQFKGTALVFRALHEIDADTAREFVRFKGSIVLEGLVRLSADTARELIDARAGSFVFYFPRLTTLDADTARELARIDPLRHVFPGKDRESGLRIAFTRGVLSLTGLTELDAHTARMLAQSPAWDGDLSSVTAVDFATARALAPFNRDLRLGLTRLDAATARAFADFKGPRLVLGSVKTLDPDVTRIVAQYPFEVGFHSELYKQLHDANPLTAETAAAYAMLANGRLFAITAFDFPDSVAIARELAARKGPLELPHLKRISPKTLAALLDKEDIVIPRIETLEIIPEPDGGPSDDGAAPNKPGGPK